MKYFPIKKGLLQREVARVHAVDDVSFEVHEGETLGLVGESGCGKSTLGRCIVRLLEPTAGDILFQGRTIADLGPRALRPLRREMQMVFQDPYASLNPRKRVGTIIGDPLKIHKVGDKSERKQRVQELLEVVGLSPEHYNRFPHEFSGGQRQRIGVARALALRPEADRRRRARLRARRLDPGPDDQPARGPAGRVRADLHLHRPRPRGRPPRQRPDRRDVPRQARRALAGRGALHAADHALHRGAALGRPDPDPDLAEKRERIVLEGDVPSPIDPPSGCRFHPRCRYATEICSQVEPPLTDYGNGHLAACHHPLNVDQATLQQVEASSWHTPKAADESATPVDSSGTTQPVPRSTNP